MGCTRNQFLLRVFICTVKRLLMSSLVLMAGLSPLAAAPEAKPIGGMYSKIAQRNIFGLIVAKQEEESAGVRSRSAQVTLQGVASILNVRQALLTIQSGANAGDAKISCVLQEGQTLGGVQVLRIDMDASAVRVINHGEKQLLATPH
ncbi:MAG: hypothetical protein D4R57_00950 [Verrucomicrobiales bacterium]|nr:MAG: hypothetical protein D4R57_00950 [Verrucomicrobiales bacterium]